MMRLEELVSMVLELPAEQVDEATGPATLKTWDSRRHIQLITALEEAYQVTFSTAEIKAMSSVGAVRRLLDERGVSA